MGRGEGVGGGGQGSCQEAGGGQSFFFFSLKAEGRKIDGSKVSVRL